MFDVTEIPGGLTIIGVTGASGAGKGAVCEILRGAGAYIVDTDKIAHEIILKGRPAYDEILETFGAGILKDDGEIDRRRLGGIAFADEQKLKTLTGITHKYIIKQSLDDIRQIFGSQTYKFAAIDAPLLIEAGMHRICRAVLGITADEEIRAERIIRRDGLTPEMARLRVKKQTPIDILRKHADFIIENNGGRQELKNKVFQFLRESGLADENQ